MELKATYKDGSVRILRPTEDFFDASSEDIEKKVKDISLDTGIPYTRDLWRDKVHIFSEVIDRNKPSQAEIPMSAKTRSKKRKLVKQLKKELLNRTFTVVTKLNGDKPKTYEIVKSVA